MFIDSHAHLDVEQYDADREAVIARARSAGVSMMLEICGSDVAKGSLEPGFKLAVDHPFIYAAVGVHPHEANLYDEALERKLLEMSEHEKVVGWGEIGLDYYYDNSPRDTQRRVFSRQLDIAPGAQSARDHPYPRRRGRYHEDSQESWVDRGGDGIGGIIHCFTGTQELADAALDMGFHISFSGVITFKNSTDLREIARSVPLDRLLIETDCPYLAPVPHRGKRNEPAFVIDTARKLAELNELSLDQIAEITSSNFKNLFELE
ncbi:MAG: TatD family hydrolase [Acidobacteria bacterium]|nr:TatD family hydrolase [Acidobacteriota bacterium]